MKKLKLKNLKLDSNNLLQRNDLKSIFGGYDGTCSNLTNCSLTTFSCASGGGTRIGYSCPDGYSNVLCYPNHTQACQ